MVSVSISSSWSFSVFSGRFGSRGHKSSALRLLHPGVTCTRGGRSQSMMALSLVLILKLEGDTFSS